MYNSLKIILLSFLILTTTTGNAQLETGNIIITPYYGAPNFGKIFGKLVEREVDYFSVTSGKGPFGIRGEYLIHEKISVGFDFIYNEVIGSGYVDSTVNNILVERYTLDVESKRFRFLIRGNFHFYSNEKFSFYTGLGIGLNIRKIQFEYTIPYFENGKNNITGSIIPISGRFALGGTYFPIKNVGINLEFGVGGPLISSGLSIKI